jgi:hypothetical protein
MAGRSRKPCSRPGEIRVVNPLWTHRQQDFYGQSKDDRIDARPPSCCAAPMNCPTPVMPAHSQPLFARQSGRSVTSPGSALNRLHGYLSDVYLASDETFFASLKKTCASLRAFRCRKTSPTRMPRISLQELAGRHLASGRKSLGERAGRILTVTAALQRQPRDRSLIVKAELIRQLSEETLANLERTKRLERLLRGELLPATSWRACPASGPLWLPSSSVRSVTSAGSPTTIRSPGTMAPHRPARAPADANATPRGGAATSG